MGEKITETQVVDLLALLRTDASIDSKVAQITNVKSGIKQNNVSDPCIAPLFEVIRISMASQHAALVSAGFTTLSHLLARLSRQEPKYMAKEGARTLPMVVEKIGDQKEKYRTLAGQCLTTFWKASPMEVERIVRNGAMTGKNSRAKEASMQWLVQMHHENGLQFRSFVPTLMELLEDADGMVRDAARNTVLDLFQNAPNAAKSDLKRQLKTFNIRPTIVAAITTQLGPSGPGAPVETESAVLEPRTNFAESMSSLNSAGPETPVVETKVEQVDPAYVNTQRELDDTFREMHAFFEGKESEQNWLKREQSCTKLRKLNAGNAPSDFHDPWLVGIKGMLDGILKAVNSLRTSLSKEGCSVVQEVAKTSGPGLDPMVEILLQNLIKLCGGTKKIASQAGDTTVDIIISKVTYNIRILQHIWLACQDKNVQPRTYAAGWLKTLLKKESHHKNHVEHTGGLELIDKCVKKGLADANPGVREKMRGTYWVFAQIWPTKAESLMATLDSTQQKLLEMDLGNPNSPKKVDPVAVRPGMGFSKSTTGPPKLSLRETMLAQKKATLAAKIPPPRPGSAMSTFSPVRTTSASTTSSTVSQAPEAAPVRSRTDMSGTASHGGLSVAPMRPTKFRPRSELTRPATAGPYTVRRAAPGAPGPAESTSSTATPSKPKIAPPGGTAASLQKRTLSRPNTSHSSHASVASMNSVSSHNSTHISPSKEKSAISRIPVSPQSSPRSSKSFAIGTQHSSPSRVDEDFTMVMPNLNSSDQQHRSFDLSEPKDVHGIQGKSLKVYEDPFSSTDDQTTPRPTFTVPVLEEVPVNEDAANMARLEGIPRADPVSPEKAKQNSHLLDSGITRVKAKSLDVHGFRKLQALIRENKALWTDDRFGALLLGLFEYLESPLTSLTPEKVQDVKAQILATIKLMLKNDRDAFTPYVPNGLQSLLQTRSSYDARAHIVSGVELLADELVGLANPEETTDALVAQLQVEEMSQEGCRTLSMGLHILKEILDSTMSYAPSGEDMSSMGRLALRCLDSSDSGVRKDAVQLCVAMHSMVGEKDFWSVMNGIKDDPKSLITYYIVKRQREPAII